MEVRVTMEATLDLDLEGMRQLDNAEPEDVLATIRMQDSTVEKTVTPDPEEYADAIAEETAAEEAAEEGRLRTEEQARIEATALETTAEAALELGPEAEKNAAAMLDTALGLDEELENVG